MMEKFIFKLISGIAISGLSASIALAQDNIIKITMNCPKIGSHANDVINYGNNLAGLGDERINGGASVDALFQGFITLGASIPVDLKAAGYKNAGVSYNPLTGAVMCKYNSSKGFASFALGYNMMNAFNGTVSGSGNQSIHLKCPVGLV
jgi:hypothetical protein